ncbi:C4-dicarboxylic acid transporter DauA [Paenibacillus konkukensis]|uniref:C4-dicarboxylic acid transporter DauA n=1 Tax=Paenibacillus konkukensis TaxID=2020716 RepID=A0ABY4RJT0_9BACL|nr:sulfate permease [Paenibacillus konkukensis]UQZ82295.1 C4-dicarboxylic acid transporter DauA [Paenibacillus konkukensis]
MKWSGRFEGYRLHMLRKDLVSGLIVGIVAIPLGMAFAIASGAKPQFGIYTTIVAGILISLLGGSKFQIGGPTGAFIPILFAIVLQYGYEKLLIAGFMAGIFLVLMGLLRLGALIRYIPRPVTVGFTSGIAVIIFSGQIGSFLGLTGMERHEDFASNMKEIAAHLHTINPWSVLTALLSLAVLLIVPRIHSKIPGSLVGLILSGIVAAVFFSGKVATIGSAYGDIPSVLPALQLPQLTWGTVKELIAPALVIALLGGIESLLSAVVADGMTGSRHNSNRELIGQGIANMVTPLFGGIPATGAIARTATNIKNGAASPLSGVIHGVVVLCILLAFAPYASLIPLASMAPILMVVAWNMSERKEFIHVLKTKTGDSLVLLVTFLLTVFTELTTAVEAGLVLAVILFVKRMSDVHKVAKVLPDPAMKHEKMRDYMVSDKHDCPQISIYTIEGPLFFGAAAIFEKTMTDAVPEHTKLLVLRLGKVPFLDSTGEYNLSRLVKRFADLGGTVLLTGVQPQPRAYLRRTGLEAVVGADHFFEHTGEAIDYALGKLDRDRCLGCPYRAFRECEALSAVPPVKAREEIAASGRSLKRAAGKLPDGPGVTY